MNFNYFKTTLKKVNKNQPKEANKWRKVERSLKLGSRLFLILLWVPKCGKESEVKLCRIYARPLCVLLGWNDSQDSVATGNGLASAYSSPGASLQLQSESVSGL